ncbi:MAG: hypothetical protein AAFX87_19720 [Bacteroidota bacterium]
MERTSKGKAEDAFKEIGKKIDSLINDLDEAKKQWAEQNQDKIEELKRNRDTLIQEFDDFKENHKDKWEAVEQSLEKAGNELKDAFNKLFSKNN